MDDSKIFIVGANGQLGTALQAKYPNAQKANIDELDITSKQSVESYDWSKVDVILNAAAYTNVDGAETPEGRIAAWKVNATAVGYLTQAAIKNDITIVHVSTDYVFDGTKEPHQEDEDLSPLGVYAQTKAASEIIVGLLPNYYVVRTSWLIGEGKNFVRTMLELGQKGIEPKVVSDQIGRLTFTPQLVDAIDHLLSTKAASGIYNVSNDGEPASWADITREIFKLAGYNLQVTDVSTEEYYAGKEGIAPRPLKSAMDLSKIQSTGLKLNDWRTDLEQYIKQELKK